MLTTSSSSSPSPFPSSSRDNVVFFFSSSSRYQLLKIISRQCWRYQHLVSFLVPPQLAVATHFSLNLFNNQLCDDDHYGDEHHYDNRSPVCRWYFISNNNLCEDDQPVRKIIMMINLWWWSLWWWVICGDEWSSLGMNMNICISNNDLYEDDQSVAMIDHVKGYFILNIWSWEARFGSHPTKIPLFGRWTILIDLLIQAPLPRNVSSLIPSLKAFSNSLRLCVRCTFEQMMNFGSHKKFRSDQTQGSPYL